MERAERRSPRNGFAPGGLAGFAGLAGLVACAIAFAGFTTLRGDPAVVTAGGATFAATAAPAGLVVTSLQTDGPSAVAGLHVGDVIDRVDGQDAPTPDQMVRAGADEIAVLHVAARGDAGARTLLLRASGGGPR